MNVRWEETQIFRYPCTYGLIFNWTKGRWELRSNPHSGVTYSIASPAEWPEFWAGFLEVLIPSVKNPRQPFVVSWHRQGDFIRVGVIMTPQEVEIVRTKPPAWYAQPSE